MVAFKFPVTSDAFAELNAQPMAEDDFDSPSRKAARLHGDSDASTSYSSQFRNKGKERENPNGITGVKHIKVINLVLSPSPPASYADSLRSLVVRGVRSIMSRPEAGVPLPGTLDQIFQACEVLVCNLDIGTGMHDILKLEIEKSVQVISRELRQSILQGLEWMKRLVELWSWYQNKLDFLRCILVSYDNDFALVNSNSGMLPVMDLGQDIFRANVTGDIFFARKLESGILAWVTRERDPSNKDNLNSSRKIIKSLIEILLIYKVYVPLFEQPYVMNTTKFYSEEGDKLSLQLTPSEFFDHCSDRIDQESSRAKECLPAASHDPVIKATESCLLRQRVSKLANEGIAPFMKAHDIAGLARMFDLFSRVDGQEVLRQSFKQNVQISVAQIVAEPSKDKEKKKEKEKHATEDSDENMIPHLITFKAFIDEAVIKAFHEKVGEIRPERSFAYAAIDAFEKGFTKRKNKPAEMIAKFIDNAMRKGQRGISDHQFQKELNDALGLYRFTPDKDVFREFYTRGLAKRLLLNRSASDDFEKAVIKKLREEYDHEFGKGDDMFRDLALSRDLTAEFQKIHPDDENLSVVVLQHSAWPIYKQVQLDLPPYIQASLNRFNTFYKCKHSNRKLEWYHGLSTVTLTARFPGATKEVSVSLFQAVVLLLYDENTDRLGYKEIHQRTGLNDADLKRTLQSLALARKRVLLRERADKDSNVEDTDVFKYNKAFKDPNRNFHISSIQQQETPEENQETTKHIDEDRLHTLDAAIVRIMKGRKKMMYEELKTETIKAVKAHFAPTVQAIKKQIDSLVGREYLERDTKDMNLYRYVA